MRNKLPLLPRSHTTDTPPFDLPFYHTRCFSITNNPPSWTFLLIFSLWSLSQQLTELVATVRMLTRQLEEQNVTMKQQEAKLADCEKTVAEQAEVSTTPQQLLLSFDLYESCSYHHLFLLMLWTISSNNTFSSPFHLIHLTY